MDPRVLICGSRSWDDRAAVFRAVDVLIGTYGDEVVIISGGAPGADQFADDAARYFSLTLVRVPAKWHILGNSAGPARNERMLYRCRPHVVIAFYADIRQSRGTRHMIGIAGDAGVPVIHIKGGSDISDLAVQLPTVAGGDHAATPLRDDT